jgi:N utilization substance protein B
MNRNARHKARRFAVQAVYQWQMAGGEPNDIEKEFFEMNDISKFDVDYFRNLLSGVTQYQTRLDAEMTPALDRPMGELSPVELAVLRIALYELFYRPDVPYKVVINEALELAKTFGSIEGFKYVNGVLDKVVSLNKLRR